ncbi:hypothetical protein [Rickettsia endosymbiont of Halotydeus destructor]|uniref:hypothetical protein n=1 Tax=Rickettsia endosymbiont of Halotydeus destructor TaxID=2996754 RepID=UPI003BAF9395
MQLKYLKTILLSGCLFYSTVSNAAAQDYQDRNLPKKNYSYVFTYDKDMSSRASADIAMSAIEGYRQLDDAVFGDSDNIAVNILSYITRFTATSWIMVGNHEIGGHGARAREFNVKIRSYEVRPFDGVTKFKTYPGQVHQRAAINTGGMQASYLLSENIKDRYMAGNKINPTYGIAYFHSRTDQPSYIFTTKFNESDKDGNDINAYTKEINSIYGDNYITKNKMRSYGYLDLIDPYLFYSAYSFIMNKDLDNIPMIELGSVRYLPATRAILAPYGLERGLLNHFIINDRYIQLGINYGKNSKFKSYGVGVKTGPLVDLDLISLGIEAAYWSQPKMLTATPLQESCKKGGFGAINFELSLNETFKIVGSGGYKTAGFIEGMPLKSSAIIRAGLKLDL